MWYKSTKELLPIAEKEGIRIEIQSHPYDFCESNNETDAQTELIKATANGKSPEYSILLLHAHDHLMNGALAKKLIAEMITMYKEIRR